jgi:hypothetical protein
VAEVAFLDKGWAMKRYKIMRRGYETYTRYTVYRRFLWLWWSYVDVTTTLEGARNITGEELVEYR